MPKFYVFVCQDPGMSFNTSGDPMIFLKRRCSPTEDVLHFEFILG